jgi:transcriptional regulator with XRE-family HTH domain
MPNNRPIDVAENPEFKTFADNVRDFRQDNGWSQRDLAAQMDTSQAYISVLETYGIDPKVTMLIRFARVFNRPVWHFFLETPPTPITRGQTRPQF